MMSDTIFGCLEPYKNYENTDSNGKVINITNEDGYLYLTLCEIFLTLTQLLMLGFLYSICDATKTNNRNYVEGDFEVYEDFVD